MEEKLVTLAILTYSKAQILKNVLENEGIQNTHTKLKGRLIAQIAINTPKKLTDEQKELLEKLQNSFGIKSGESSGDEGIFDKIKSWFK